MGKGLILGIDFSTDYTQLAYLDIEGVPQSISMGTEDNFLIPTVVCYNSELNEWTAGDEAVNKGRLGKSKLYKNLPEMFESKADEVTEAGDADDTEKADDSDNIDEETLGKVMSTYMSYLLKVAVNYCNGKLIKSILVTLEDVTPEKVEGLTAVFESLGYEDEDIKIISHSESFVYYVLNQNKDIWLNSVYFLNFDRHSLKVRRLNAVKGREPHVVDVTVDDLSDRIDMEMLAANSVQADLILSDYMEEKLKKHVVSGVYLSGEGFYTNDWEKTLKTICGNRRVFKGNNLIVKGAAYGAREFFYSPMLSQYLISCKGRTRVKVTMAVKYKGRENTITLSEIGDYWYQAGSRAECIMENPTEAEFKIHDYMNHDSETFKIDLNDFPKRPLKTTRIEVKFRYTSENTFEIEITDLGFGEFFKSSGMSVKKEITL